MPASRARVGTVIEGSAVIPPRVAPNPDVDESLWRESNIPIGRTIKKTEAQKEYGLTKAEIETLPCTKLPHNIIVSGVEIRSKKFVFQEREVERLAWRKFGGPEGFEAHKVQMERNRARRASTSPSKSPRKPRKRTDDIIGAWEGYQGDDNY